jgi:hypothetical protein
VHHAGFYQYYAAPESLAVAFSHDLLEFCRLRELVGSQRDKDKECERRHTATRCYKVQRTMRRIIVVGCQGSGKTSLAIRLGRKLGLPVVHLDVPYWRPGWKAYDKASFCTPVTDAIAGEVGLSMVAFQDWSWITLARADTLVTIDRPRWLCLWRIAWRSAFDRDPMRPDLPEG